MDEFDHQPGEDGTVLIGGRKFMPDARGGFIPLEAVKPQHQIEDEVVRKVVGHARELSAQIGRFKGHVFEDLSGLDQLLAQEYSVKRGGRKGNRSYVSHDGLLKVQVAMADLIDFGAELQQAKALIDECLVEWTDDSGVELRAIVLRAFNVEKSGLINKAELFGLRRLQIADARWQEAMRAISDGIRVVGAKQYFRFYQRASVEARFTAIAIDLAQVA